ncbi:MAG TPA: hypothetical protein VFI32_10435 [Rhodanobacteraceae bacterium]|nr:hypothetical protein [Rhodanobacteraceae bacterium]
MAMFERLRAQFQDAQYLYIVPLIAALLPWALARRWLVFWAQRTSGPYEESAQTAAVIAPDYMDVGDLRAFRSNVRLIWLLDAYDLFLSVTRWRRCWWPDHIEQVGAWPESGAFIATSFHHGTGLWTFKSLTKSGRDSLLIYGRWAREDYLGRPLLYRYGRWRAREVQRLSGQPVAYRPGVRERVARSLADGISVVGVIDMPPRLATRGQRPVRLLDRDISFPNGVLDLAQNANVPIIPYWVEFDLARCTRRLCIGAPLDPADTSGTLQALADILDRQIRATPSAWYFWRELPEWIAAAAKARE